MSGETRDMLREQLESTREGLDALWSAIDGNAECEADDYESCENTECYAHASDLHTILGELPLEVVWERGEPFAVVLGTGGPHVEIRGGSRHDGAGYALHGYWSGEHVTLHGSDGSGIARTGEYFREMVEGDE